MANKMLKIYSKMDGRVTSGEGFALTRISASMWKVLERFSLSESITQSN